MNIGNDIEEGDLDHEDLNRGSIFHGIYIPNPIDFDAPAVNKCTQETKHRLIIHTIELVNFKSYAKKKIVGPFHQCFTAIIGPNGCGKSNVIDSLLFVFGFRSKKIRIKTLKNIIHKSDGFEDVRKCSVTVNFKEIIDKDDGSYEEIPNSKLSIKRVLHKDGQSNYYIDDRKKNFKDILSMLKEKYGVDLVHNRFLILQGEVEQIALMKAKASNENETGFLEYIDDIIGTNMYDDCLKKLSEILKQKIEDRFYKIDRVKVKLEEKDKVEKDMNEAVLFLKEENEVIEKRNMHYQFEIFHNKHQRDILKEERKEFDVQKTNLDNKFKEIEALRKENECLANDFYKRREDLITEQGELQNTYSNLEEKDSKYQGELNKLNKSKKSNLNNLENTKKYLSDTENDPEENAEQLNDHSENLKTLEENLHHLTKEHEQKQDKCREEIKPKMELKDKIDKEMVFANDIAVKSKQELENAQRKLKQLLMEKTDCDNKLTGIENELKSTKKGLIESSKEIETIREKIPKLQSEKEQYEHELRKVAIERTNLLKETYDLRAYLNEKKTASEGKNSRSRIVNALLREKQEGNLSGVFGRLGDLGGIDNKYDIAISTACGSLDNILVDTTDTARNCINYLKKTNLGSAYFIVLDKQNYLISAYQKPFRAPENLPRLFDLIQVSDERVKPAFYYALHDTLVANDIQQATRIAYGSTRFRVVTLRGELIEMSGTMSGGGNQPMRGRMGKSVAIDTSLSDSSVHNMENDLEFKETRLKEIQEQEINFKELILQLNHELPKLKYSENTLLKQIDHFNNIIVRCEKHKKETNQIMKTIKIDESQKNQIEKLIVDLRKKYDDKQQAYNKFQKQLDDLNAEIEKYRSKYLKESSDAIIEVQNAISVEKKAISKIQLKIVDGKKLRHQAIEKISKLEADLKIFDEQIDSLTKIREELTSQASEIRNKLKEIDKSIKDHTKNYFEINDETKKHGKKLSSLKEELGSVNRRLNEIITKFNECEANLIHYQDQKQTLKLNSIPKEINSELKTYTSEELNTCDVKTLKSQIKALQELLNQKRPDVTSVEEYFKVEEEYLERVKELQEISTMIDSVKKKLEEIRKQRVGEFYKGMSIIGVKLKELYRMLSCDGDAHLEVVDSFDPYSEGVTFNVRPPRKSWRNIRNLSGGEKTLASMALIFALHHFKPSPLYVMDEIDAALDFRNVSIIGHYIKQSTKNTQFIVISLREHMYKLAPILIGVYKLNDKSRTVYFDPKKFERGETNNTSCDEDGDSNSSDVSL